MHVMKKGILYAVLASVLWAIVNPFIKQGLSYDFSPMNFAGLRFTVVGIILFAYTWHRGMWREIMQHRRLFGNLILINMFMGYTAFYFGVDFVSGAISSIVMGLTPLINVLLAHLVASNDRLNRYKVVSLAVSLAGLLLIVGTGSDGSPLDWRGIGGIVLLLACIVFSLLASFGIGEGEHLMWCLSATFTAAAGFGGALAYGRSFHKVARRVSQSGGALAGWPGAAGSRRGNRVLITDLDLFPPGFVELNGIKVFGDFSVERVVGYTATLIRDSGCGLEKLFHDLLRTQGAIFRRADSLCCYEGGGLSANIRGDQVLVGSAAFMNLMEVPLPQGLNVKNAVFCAIDGELAGIFALNYTLPDTVFPSLTSLLRERVGPVLATRDFNLIPAMLQQRFKLTADRMDFPPVERRRELSDPEQDHTGVLTAVLCREGLLPFAESVVGARRLRRAVRASAVLTCAGSTLGVLLAYYLTSVDAYASLSPLNLLFYLLMWLLPVWFLSGWVHRY